MWQLAAASQRSHLAITASYTLAAGCLGPPAAELAAASALHLRPAVAARIAAHAIMTPATVHPCTCQCLAGAAALAPFVPTRRPPRPASGARPAACPLGPGGGGAAAEALPDEGAGPAVPRVPQQGGGGAGAARGCGGAADRGGWVGGWVAHICWRLLAAGNGCMCSQNAFCLALAIGHIAALTRLVLCRSSCASLAPAQRAQRTSMRSRAWSSRA